MLLSICIIEIVTRKERKNKQKEAGIGPFFKKLYISLHLFLAHIGQTNTELASVCSKDDLRSAIDPSNHVDVRGFANPATQNWRVTGWLTFYNHYFFTF